MTQKTHTIPLAAEMAIIVTVAAAIGCIWHYQTLKDVMAGKAVQGTAKKAAAPPTTAAPLPLGLQQAKELYDSRGATFVDARDGSTYAAGHIKGALSLPLGDFDTALPRFKASVPPTATLVVYCNGFDCHDSMDLGNKLIKGGYGTVYVFLGGFPEWKDAGYAIEGGQP